MKLFLEKEKKLSGYMRSTVFPIKKLIIINIWNYTYTRPLQESFFNKKHEHNNQDTISTLVQDHQYKISA